MLPVVCGRAETRRQILIYSLMLAPLGIAPWLAGYAGALYGAVAVVAGAVIVALALQVMRERELVAAKRLFAFSILYLFMLFAVLLADDRLSHLLGRTV
jgi:protoheme IX farnesyltransferase